MTSSDILTSLPTTSEELNQLADDRFVLSQEGQILYKQADSDESAAVARLAASEQFYAPNIEILILEQLDPDQIKAIEERLARWLTDTVKKTFEFLFMLEHTQISGTAKGIAFRLYEEHGIIFRPRIQDLIKPLELADRQALSRLGVRIGAHYVYVKDCLKPASINLMSILWRTANAQTAEHAITPPDGNVSFAVSDKAPKRFYLTIGFPIFGDLAVRADMIERLNSAIFEQAVDGQYTFDPALASTIGASVEQTHKVLHDLGFPAHEETIAKPAKPDETPSEESPSDSVEEAKKTDEATDETATAKPAGDKADDKSNETETRVIYSLKRIKPHSDRKPKHLPRNKDGQSDRKPKKSKKPTGSKKSTTVVQDKSHGHNAFAGLGDLLKQQQEKK